MSDKRDEAAEQTATGPLAGIRILDMSSVVLGPFATQVFADLGADVIKLEHGVGDLMRHAGKAPVEGMGPMFMNLNRNKRCIHLNLKQPLAAEALRRLLRGSDVFFHNVRMAGMERLGFDYDAVARLNPQIVYVHCCGYGSAGEYGGRQAYDDLIQAASGAASLLQLREERAGRPSEPQYIPSLIADKTTGLYATYATLAALFHRERTGEGQFVEVPMLESFVHFTMVEHLYGQTFVPATGGVAYTRSVNHRRKPFRTLDGYISLVPYDDGQWRRFFELGGKPGAFDEERFASPQSRAENVEVLYALIEEVVATKTTAEWLRMLDEENIPAMRYTPMDEIVQDAHLKSVDFFHQRQHEQVGDYLSMRHPVRFEATPADIRRDPAPLGQDTHEVLAELDFDEEQIRQLIEKSEE